MEQVAVIFIENINQILIKTKCIKQMQKVAMIKKEIREKKEALQQNNAISFHNLTLKKKIFKIWKNYYILQKKKRIFEKMKNYTKKEKEKNQFKLIQFNNKKIFNMKKIFFYLLKGIKKEKNEKIMKEEIINKLKNKAQMLLGDFK